MYFLYHRQPKVLLLSGSQVSTCAYFYIEISGVSANADPHTKKLRARVTRIWGYRRLQPNRSAMVRPRSGGTTLLIMVSPAPGKYDLFMNHLLFIIYFINNFINRQILHIRKIFKLFSINIKVEIKLFSRI